MGLITGLYKGICVVCTFDGALSKCVLLLHHRWRLVEKHLAVIERIFLSKLTAAKAGSSETKLKQVYFAEISPQLN